MCKFRQTHQVYWNGMLLRKWRQQQDIDIKRLANRLNISHQTMYRIENGYPPTVDLAHSIVRTTHGAIRYRDFWPGFHHEYA